MKKRIWIIADLLIIIVMFNTCVSKNLMTNPDINVTVKPGSAFSKDAGITVVSKNNTFDITGAEGLITNQLIIHGFNVISNAIAKGAVKYNQEVNRSNSGSSEMNAELFRVKN